MSKMDFTMFPLKLLRDRRWLQLSGDKDCQLVYRTLWACEHTDYGGLFHCPHQYIAHDLKMSCDQIYQTYGRLAATDLIEYSEITGFVRIIGWYKLRYCPDNFNELKGRSAPYLDGSLPPDLLTSRSAAELIVSGYQCAKTLPKHEERNKRHHANYIGRLEVIIRHGIETLSGFETALMQEFSLYADTLQAECEWLVHSIDALSAEVARNCGLRIGPDPLEALGEGYRSPSEDLAQQKRREEKNKRRIPALESSAVQKSHKTGSSPRTATIQSDLAQSARGATT